jgi:hypothetical protein
MSMSQLGIGVWLRHIAGESPPEASKYLGRKITAAALVDRDYGGTRQLALTFEDGKKIAIFDDGQSCCESRYITTDDDVGSLVGHILTRIEAKDGPDTEDEHGDMHETCFVEIGTDDGFVTLVNHNEHNGYYGGFGLSITEI